MNITLPQAVFLFLAAVIVVCSILTVTTKRILRSATYLLFVLFATAGIYFELNYHCIIRILDSSDQFRQ